MVDGEKASSCGNSPNKYQLPSPMIVLTKQEEAELRDVIMQMTLRDCGLQYLMCYSMCDRPNLCDMCILSVLLFRNALCYDIKYIFQ